MPGRRLDIPTWLARLPKPAAHWSRLFALGALVGVLGGGATAALKWGLHGGSELLAGRFTHLGAAGVMNFEWGVLLLPALGGLGSGVLVWLLCPRAVGHGVCWVGLDVHL